MVLGLGVTELKQQCQFISQNYDWFLGKENKVGFDSMRSDLNLKYSTKYLNAV